MWGIITKLKFVTSFPRFALTNRKAEQVPVANKSHFYFEQIKTLPELQTFWAHVQRITNVGFRAKMFNFVYRV